MRPGAGTRRTNSSELESAGDDVDRKPTLAGFLVSLAHVVSGLAHGLDTGVERNEMLAVALHCQRCRRDRLDRAQRIAFDAGHLHQSGDGVAGHAKMMFQRNFRKHPAWAAAGLFWRAAVDFDEVAEAFDAELGEGHGSVRVLRIVDPDQPVFGLHVDGDVGEPVRIFAEVPCDERQGSDGVDLVDLHPSGRDCGGRLPAPVPRQ